MNEIELCKAIRARLRYDLRNVQLPSQGRGDRVAPRIVDTYLLPARTHDPSKDTDFPFVIVRPTGGSSRALSDESGTTATIRLIMGVHTARNPSLAMERVLLLMIKIREELFKYPILGGTPFMFAEEWDWMNFDEQREPYYEIWADTTWQLPQPQRVQGGLYVGPID